MQPAPHRTVTSSPVTPEEKERALDRALTSHALARSEQLRGFLKFVCEAEIRGTGSEITEYVIGTAALHRPAGYSPTEDSIVRTRAYELRQKLEKLYSTELAHDGVRIVIPKGAYIPQFVRPEVEPEVPAPAEIQPQPARSRSLLVAAWLLSGVLIGAGLTYYLGAKSRQPPALIAEAWAPFAKRSGPALLMAATPLYLVLGPDTHPTASYRTPIYPAPPEAYPIFRQQRPLEPNAKLGMIFTHDALGVGSMNAVVTVSNALRSLQVSSEILPERPNMMSLLRGRDAVLFGAPVDSQAISEVLASTPLSVEYDPAVREFVILDRARGKVIAPVKNRDGEFLTVYGLVTVLNDRDTDRGRLGMVVFSGITSVGTAGAAEFFTSTSGLRSLQEALAREGISGFPPAYQVVVECRFENMLLVAEQYHLHRVIKAR